MHQRMAILEAANGDYAGLATFSIVRSPHAEFEWPATITLQGMPMKLRRKGHDPQHGIPSYRCHPKVDA